MYFNETGDYIVKARKSLNLSIISKGMNLTSLKIMMIVMILFIIINFVLKIILHLTLDIILLIAIIMLYVYNKVKTSWTLEIGNGIVHIHNLFRTYDIPYKNLINMSSAQKLKRLENQEKVSSIVQNIRVGLNIVHRSISHNPFSDGGLEFFNIRIEYMEKSKVNIIEIPYAHKSHSKYEQYIANDKLWNIDGAFLTKNEIGIIDQTDYVDIRKESVNKKIEEIIEKEVQETYAIFSSENIAKHAIGIIMIAFFVIVICLILGSLHL